MCTRQHKYYIVKTCGSIRTKNDGETGGSDAIIQTPFQPFPACAVKETPHWDQELLR